MTITADVNARTGLRFSATLVTAAIAAAGTIIGGRVGNVFVEDASEVLDSAVTLMASHILVEGKNIRNLSANTSQYELKTLFTPEIKRLLGTYLKRGQSFYADISPQERQTSTVDHWRE